MLRYIASITMTLGLTAASSHAEDIVLVLPESFSGPQQRLKADIDAMFLDRLKPGGTMTIFNGTRVTSVAQVALPDDERFERKRYRVKKFASELGKMLSFAEEASTNGKASADILLPEFFAFYAANRTDAGTPEVMIIGGGLYASPSDSSAAIRLDADQSLYVPSQRLILGSLEESPYGTAGQEDTLSGLLVHMCDPYADTPLSTFQEAALRKAWGLWLKAQGAVLLTFTQDLSTCIDRFTQSARNVPEAYEFDSEQEDMLAMLRVRREPLSLFDLEPNWPRPEISVFTEFESHPHPYMAGVEIDTGTRFRRETWPDFSYSWCNVSYHRNGVRILITLGNRSPKGDVVWQDITPNELEAAGISLADAEAGRTACRLPGDPL